MKTIPVRVRSVSIAAKDIRLVQLAALDGKELPSYTPGSHIDLHLGPGLTRQYSLCGQHSDFSSYTIAVKREPTSRGGSKAVHEDLTIGSTLQISPPRNTFPMAPQANYTVLIAGGIGITPLISMARALLARGEAFELLYFCRSVEHAVFRDELECSANASRYSCHFGLEHADVTQVLQRTLFGAAKGSHLYLCGPASFMRAVLDAASNAQWPEENVHLEYFSPHEPVANLVNDEAAFDLQLGRSGITVEIPVGETITGVLCRYGVKVATSCEQGICGTCLTDVLEGVPDHRDSFLTPVEKARGDSIILCVSRSKSPLLILDI